MSDENVKRLLTTRCAGRGAPRRQPDQHDRQPHNATSGAKTIGSTHSAGTSIAVLRARFSVRPFAISRAGTRRPRPDLVAIW